MILELRSNFLIHFKLDFKLNEPVAIVCIMINKHVGKGSYLADIYCNLLFKSSSFHVSMQ